MPIPRPAKQPCVYILASKRDGVLYIGVTSDLSNRVSLHKQDLIQGFTKKYGCTFSSITRRITRCRTQYVARSS
jgi:predicted GIY-YIG superfamily endonuclease